MKKSRQSQIKEFLYFLCVSENKPLASHIMVFPPKLFLCVCVMSNTEQFVSNNSTGILIQQLTSVSVLFLECFWYLFAQKN